MLANTSIDLNILQILHLAPAQNWLILSCYYGTNVLSFEDQKWFCIWLLKNTVLREGVCWSSLTMNFTLLCVIAFAFSQDLKGPKLHFKESLARSNEIMWILLVMGGGDLTFREKMHDFYLHGFWLIFIKFPLHIWVSRCSGPIKSRLE